MIDYSEKTLCSEKISLKLMSLLTEYKSIIEHGKKKEKKRQIKSILMSVAAAPENPTSYHTEHSDAQHIQPAVTAATMHYRDTGRMHFVTFCWSITDYLLKIVNRCCNPAD